MTGKSIPCYNFLYQTLHLAAGRYVGEPDFIGQSRDELIAFGGEGGGDAAFASCEAGKNQETVIGERLLPVWRKAHVLKAAGRTDNDWLASAQKDAETLVFHRRMKTADDTATDIAPTCGFVVSSEDGVAGATGGTKERGFRQCEQVQITESG